MMRSLYSGVSGLAIHQTKMDVIGNNIANVNTVGFKSSRVTFSEIFSQTVRSATGASENLGGTNPMQIGLGASISSIDVNMTEGAAQVTNNNLDIKIEGSGFFVVSDSTGNYFTRAGAFLVDNAGNLVNSSGMKVMGWPADENNEIQKGTVESIQILSAENLYSDPTATTAVTVSGNVNMNDEDLESGGVPFTAQFYDNLGYLYTASFTMNHDAADPDTDYTIQLTGVKDGEGQDVANFEMLDNGGAAQTDIPVTFDIGTGKITVPADANFSLVQNPANDQYEDITIDFSSLTMFDGNSTLEGVRGDSDGNNSGSAAGSLSDYEVSSDGQVYGRYTNGDTKLFGQIVVAQFQNPAGLQKQGNNLFSATTNSGDFDGIGEDITSSGGKFNSGTLEMSNVDLSSEFTEMITTQRGFQANSRIITASDEMLTELVNLKR